MEISPQTLADINLMVEQRNLDHAQFLAQEQLLLHPNSATIHALMGDIAAARHNSREAIDWYELSLRLDNNPQVRSRLDRQRTLLEQQAEDEIDQMLARPAGGRQRRLLIAAIVGGLVILALLVLLIASLVPRGRTTARRTEAQGVARPAAQPGMAQVGTGTGGATTGAGTGGAPGFAPGRPGTAAPSRPGATPGGSPQYDASGRPINITQSVDAPMSDRDRLLTQGLSGITWPTGEALGWRVQAAVDDFTGYAMITVQLPPGMQSADLSATVIDMAYRLAVATVQADSGIQSLTIRLLADVEVEDRERSLLAFRGNTNRENLEYYLKRNIQPDRQTIWERVFATTWWNPSVPTGTEAASQ